MLDESTPKYGALTVGGNYSKVAEGLNVESRRVSKPTDIIPAVKATIEATSAGRPILLEAVINHRH